MSSTLPEHVEVASPGRGERAHVRTLHVITSLGSGGAERTLSNVVRGVARVGVECEVLCLTPGGRYASELRHAGIRVHAPDRAGAVALVATLLRAFRDVRRRPVDMVQGWLPHGNLVATCLGAVARRPVLWNVRQSVYDLAYESPGTARVIRMSSRVSRRVARIIYNSAVSAEQHARLGFARDRAVVVFNGFDVGAFVPDPAARDAVRQEFQVAGDELVIGVVARYHMHKDFPNALRALRRLRDRGVPAVLVCAGQGVDPRNPELAALIEQSGIGAHVRLLGEFGDVTRLYAGLDVLCLPSITEGFPNVVGEAMACGVPCVATDVGASRELIGDTGRVVAPRDDAALADALAELCLLDAPRRRALGRAARARVERRFSLDQITRQYAAIYEDIAAHGTKR